MLMRTKYDFVASKSVSRFKIAVEVKVEALAKHRKSAKTASSALPSAPDQLEL